MPHSSKQILQTLETLPTEDLQQILDFVELISKKRQQVKITETEAAPRSFFDVAQASIGSGEGPSDLSTNPAYMQGYGH